MGKPVTISGIGGHLRRNAQLERLTGIPHHRIRIAQGDPVTGVSAINAEQAGVFSALGVNKPAAPQQLSLL